MRTNENEIIAEAIRRAQIGAREHGLAIGSIVGHPDYDEAFKLASIEGNTATVLIKPKIIGKEPSRLTLPLNELFDANEAFYIAREIKVKGVIRHISN